MSNSGRMGVGRASVLAIVLALGLAVAGCGTYPADPSGTLDRVTGGTLRVGASENGEWVVLPGIARGPSAGTNGTRREQDVQGTDADLVRGFADRLGAEIEWVSGAEHVLAEAIKHGELDVVIGGLDDKTPWAQHGGLTRPYAESRTGHGSPKKHVMLVPLGENAFLLELDRYLMEAKEQR